MKTLTITFLFLGLFISCNDNCSLNLNTCLHTPPTDEICAANFTRWFYNSENNECEQITYNGCEQWGFESLEACQECLCD